MKLTNVSELLNALAHVESLNQRRDTIGGGGVLRFPEAGSRESYYRDRRSELAAEAAAILFNVQSTNGTEELQLRCVAGGEHFGKDWLCKQIALLANCEPKAAAAIESMSILAFGKKLVAKKKKDSKTDNEKKSWVKTPDNTNVSKLAKRINSDPDKQRTKKDIALEFTDYDDKKANTLLRELRRFPHLLKTTGRADN